MTLPAFTDPRESTRWNSLAPTPSRAGVECAELAECAKSTAYAVTATRAARIT